MSAQSVEVVTLVFPNPEWFDSSDGQAFQRVNSSISFDYLTSFDIRTLSTNGASPGTDVTGLLYVPDLDPTDPCVSITAPYVPQNVTRQGNLPNTDYDLVAIAPWVSANCTQSYLESARGDPLRGFMFFLPDNGTATPPEPDSNVWDLNDGGRWKSQNDYPVYAIPGASGQIFMTASSQYSGNMTDVPNGHLLTESYDSRDYVRVFVDIDTTGNSGELPSLWVFLLIVLGILLAVIGLTSLSMHWLQRRRRQSLRRRVANGEVDLEALGIKRLTVPQEILDEMPLYTYGSGAPVPPNVVRAVTESEHAKSASVVSSRPSSPEPKARPSPALLRPTSYLPTPLQQPTCAICLDDFVPAGPETQGTIVRELPCHHIFHPECVDTFLRDSSSLCPMCKKTTLPKGYCPRVVTNAMVRRERMVRRIRERVTVEPDADEREGADNASPLSLSRRIRTRTFSGLSSLRVGRRMSLAPRPTSEGERMTELSTQPSPSLVRSQTSAPNSPWHSRPRVQEPYNPMRREWARRRAVAMLGQQAPADPDAEDARTTQAWRKALRGIFPSAGR